MATAAVVGVPGATYTWTVDGGLIVGDAASDRINIALGTQATATVSVSMTAGGCVASGSGVIALRDSFNVRVAAIPAARVSEPLTIVWTYENGVPAQQNISGGDFGPLTLAPGARSYTYTPQTSGSTQFVIDAAMVMPPGLEPVMSRRRSVAKSPASASACASAHSSMPYTVGACVDPAVVIDGPDSVVTGTSFQLSVRPQPGAVATWTISNGSPATATGESVMVTAGSSGNVDVSVRLTRGACMGQLSRSIAIDPAPVCHDPKASVSAGPVSCGSGIVNASFTGIPPFQGLWSDGVPFNTNATAIARKVTMPGNYSIIRFEDAACAGTSSGTAVLPALGPTATISGKPNSCSGVDTVTIQFDGGKPPYSVRWLDNSFSVTNDAQMVKTFTNEDGTGTITYAYDGTGCYFTMFNDVHWHRTPKLHVVSYCEGRHWDNVVLLQVPFSDYTPPLSVTWSDGVTTTDDYDPIYRSVKPAQTTTYAVVSAHDANCSALFDGLSSAKVYASPIPDIILGGGDMCAGTTATGYLRTPPPSDAAITWWVEGNGTILSGQGTSSILYLAGDVGLMTLGCDFTFPGDACPTTQGGTVRIDAPPVGTMSLEKPQIHAGQSVQITYTVDTGTAAWNLSDPLNDSIVLQGGCGAHTICHALYTSSHGPAETTITLELTGFCVGKKTVVVPLSIVP
jgi:hypothetical protein